MRSSPFGFSTATRRLIQLVWYGLQFCHPGVCFLNTKPPFVTVVLIMGEYDFGILENSWFNKNNQLLAINKNPFLTIKDPVYRRTCVDL